MAQPITALVAAVFLFGAAVPAAATACKAPAAVCAVAERVYAVSSFEPVASAVLIRPSLLVTNRHVVANNEQAEVFLPDRSVVVAKVVPTGFVRDLVLLRVQGFADAPALETAPPPPDGTLYVVGADVGRGAVRVYPPGRLLAAPDPAKPMSRIHHDARSFPGNSAGALVDARGRLVGIVASGGEGRNEAIPAAEIVRFEERSGPAEAAASRSLGLAYRKCAAALDNARGSRQAMTAAQADFMTDQCRQTGNRQLMDLAGQTFGQRRMLDRARAMLGEALDLDPAAPNALMAMAVTLHMAQRYEE